MEKEVVLKKAIVGGFDCRQVIEYIEFLKKRLSQSEAETDELKALERQLAELQRTISQRDDEIERLTHEATQNAEGISFNRVSVKLMKESSKYADSYIESVKVLARSLNERTNEKVDSAKKKVEVMLASLSEISDSVVGLYSSLNELKDEYENFGRVYSATDLSPDPNVPLFKTEVENDDSSEAEDSSADGIYDLIAEMKEKYKNMLDEI